MTTDADRVKPLEACSLSDCPVGLFMAGDTLCFKSEYGNNEGRIDAYIISSGEFFWGAAPQTIESQRSQIVRPIDEAHILAALAPAPQAAAWTEERLREEAKRRGWYIRENTSVPDLTTGGWKHPFSVTASSRELLELLATADRAAAPQAASPVPEGWVLVPRKGAVVKADHPITAFNPTETFTILEVKMDERSEFFARGEETIWFNIRMLAAAQEGRP